MHTYINYTIPHWKSKKARADTLSFFTNTENKNNYWEIKSQNIEYVPSSGMSKSIVWVTSILLKCLHLVNIWMQISHNLVRVVWQLVARIKMLFDWMIETNEFLDAKIVFRPTLLKIKGASWCHRITFLSKWFHKEPLTSEEPFCCTKGSVWWKKVLQIIKS